MINNEIIGLCWNERRSIEISNGFKESHFPTTHLVHLVFHGRDPFRHTHFGIHLGFSDQLTFLGSSEKTIKGYFIDCRKNSPTLHKRVVLTCKPDVNRTLYIPCGVAHAFEGMEDIFTINNFEALLPDPSVLLTSESPWASGADIKYFPLEVNDNEIPVVQENIYPASEKFYDLLSEMQRATLGSVTHEYPHTEEITFPNGASAKVMVRRPISDKQKIEHCIPLIEIEGLAWHGHLVVWSGTRAGYCALVDQSPIKIIDHKSQELQNQYFVDLNFESRFTFVGSESEICTIKLIDCRENSKTLHKDYLLEFTPSEFKFLIIPPGVAYCFMKIKNVFTINRALKKAGNLFDVNETSEILTWRVDQKKLPIYNVKMLSETPLEYYKELSKRQLEMLVE